MIFSVWDPDGGYEYFDTPQRHGIGDDLPDVKMPILSNEIGTPSQDVGREVPRGAKAIGRGAEPKGVMAPMRRGQVRGLSGGAALGLIGKDSHYSIVVIGLAVWAGYWWGTKK